MKDIRFNRERFSKGNSYYGKQGISAQTAQIRIETPLVKGKDTYDFDIAKEVKKLSEKTLKRNDLFVVRAIGLALMIENKDYLGHSPLLSYPLMQSTALPEGCYGFTSNDPYCIYNGHLTVKTGQHVNYSAFPTSSFLHIPETQPFISGGKSAEVIPSFKMSDILMELPEEIVLAGTQDHRIKLEVPANSDTDFTGVDNTGDPVGFQSHVVLIFEGWLYEGATSQEFKNDMDNPYRLSI